ncbi:hypothetical protein LOAG_11685 [Loa loa]|uniref:Uncharacterized protein n=1 Tax=Loa loa TaxID=7209 RepID=A0A1S0TMM9_LOALO|nr:hypothetical protein LOAG_11685 [Loa loa]EFO16818.2 hypothetical protein LOAG_11685 [Loa loa]
MDLKYLAILTFIVRHMVSSNITSAAGGTGEDGPSAHKKGKLETKFRYPNDELLSVFRQVGHIIVNHLPHEDLKSLSKALPMLYEYESPNYELNRLNRILHYRDGKITPRNLENALELVSRMNFIDDQHRKSFAMNHWTPYQAILFGREKPINAIFTAYHPCSVLIFTSYKDHLEILERSAYTDKPFQPVEIKGSPMNGVIFPYDLSFPSYKPLYLWQIEDLVRTKYYKTNYLENYEISVRYDPVENAHYDTVKLVIVISSGPKSTYDDAENKALNVIKEIREKNVNAPICVVAQSDNRKRASNINSIGAGKMLKFYGTDVKASTLLVDKNDNSEMLKTKFEDWKKELLFFNSHQLIAFHFTKINDIEPEDSEEIFSNTFPNIPLSTLRLLDESSMTGVDYQIGTEFRFHAGPVYAIVGFQQFGRKFE